MFTSDLYLHTSFSNCYLLVYIMLFKAYSKTPGVAPLPWLVGGTCSPFSPPPSF